VSQQFLITAYDYTDDKAIERRLAARPAHVELIEKLHSEGKLLMGAAILDDSGKMIGSSLVGEFSDRNELDSWLDVEPYVTNRVWEKIEVRPCSVGKVFLKGHIHHS
jgi:uncharacterized protein YciI